MDSKCSISNSSLKFARNVSGFLIMVAYLLKNVPMTITIAVIMLLGAVSIKMNIFYQFHFKFLGKNKLPVSERDKGEIIFSWTMGGLFLVIGLVLVYYDLALAGWIFILMTSLLMFCAGFLNFCVASMMYAVFKKMIQSKKK
ncbi:MAG: DUF4395 family protein [Candidatus Paceibacterota bacterium]